MKISIFLILLPFTFSYNQTLFLEPENNLLVDTVVKLMEDKYIPRAKGFSVSTTPTINSKSLKKTDLISKLFKSLKLQIKYRFVDSHRSSLDRPRQFNVVFLMDYIDLRFVICIDLNFK